MKLRDIVFCDDIRFEQNKKVSLMGIFNDKIIVKIPPKAVLKGPIQIRLSILLRFLMENGDEHPNSFSFKHLLNGKNLNDFSGPLNIVQDSMFVNLTILANNLPVNQGHLGFEVVLKNNETEIIKVKNENAIEIIVEEMN